MCAMAYTLDRSSLLGVDPVPKVSVERTSPFVSDPAPVYTVGSPDPHAAVLSTDSGSTLNWAAAMVASAAAAAVRGGAVGGVVLPLNTPPSNTPPEPARV